MAPHLRSELCHMQTPHFVCRYILSLKGLKISDLLREIVVFFFRSEKTYFHNGSMVQKADLEVQSSGNLWENHLPFLGEIRGDRELKGYIFFSIWDGISSKNGMVDVCFVVCGTKKCYRLSPQRWPRGTAGCADAPRAKCGRHNARRLRVPRPWVDGFNGIHFGTIRTADRQYGFLRRRLILFDGQCRCGKRDSLRFFGRDK